MGFITHIDDTNLTELIFFINNFKKTGKLEIITFGMNGVVYFDNGKIYHAVFKHKSGPEALYLIALEEDGEFKFKADARIDEKTFTEESGNIISEIERRKKEIHNYVKKLPPFDTILAKATQLPQSGKVSMRKTDWRILLLINGKRNLKEIIEQSSVNIVDVYGSLVWLLENGFVYDKEKVKNSLRKLIKNINIFLKEFGAFDIDIKPWYDDIRRIVEEMNGGKNIVEVFEFFPNEVKLNLDKIYLVGIDDLRILDEIIDKTLYKKALAELGPMLAKKKYNEIKESFE